MKWIVVLIVVSIGVIVAALSALSSRQQIARAREQGLWPAMGQIPSDEDVKRLAKAGEKILAIKLCRQIHGMGLAEAKAAVEILAQQLGDTAVASTAIP